MNWLIPRPLSSKKTLEEKKEQYKKELLEAGLSYLQAAIKLNEHRKKIKEKVKAGEIPEEDSQLLKVIKERQIHLGYASCILSTSISFIVPKLMKNKLLMLHPNELLSFRIFLASLPFGPLCFYYDYINKTQMLYLEDKYMNIEELKRSHLESEKNNSN